MTPRLPAAIVIPLLCLCCIGCKEKEAGTVDLTDDEIPTEEEGEPRGTDAKPLGARSVLCDELEARLLDCDVISEGVFSCAEPYGIESICAFNCVFDAACDSVGDFMCGYYYHSTLEDCIDTCMGIESVVCDNGELRISADWVCDGEVDCEDGSDEVDCVEFNCADSGETIPENWVCDLENDCDDGSDEADCPEFQCASGETIPENWVCDYHEDCADGSDEGDCPGVACESGETIPDTWVCDFYEDCADGSDEVDCPGVTCESGETIPDAWVCDFYEDCADGSDEFECPYFSCGGQDIPVYWECDGFPDCADGSDEHAGCAEYLCV